MNNKRFHQFHRLWFGMVMMSLFLNSCGPAGTVNKPKGKVIQSQVQRIQDPQTAESDLKTLVAGNTQFGLDFYSAIRDKPGNQFFSPYSLSTVLAMTYGGARQQTAEQMAAVLHFNLPQEQLHPAFNTLDLLLNQENRTGAGGADAQPFQLDVANSIWGQDDYPFREEYLALLAGHYGAGLRLADFVQDAENARQEINDWVSEKTQQKIQDLIPEGGVNSDTRMVLANAIYFKADWLHPFEKNNTTSLPFHLLDGSRVEVPTMAFDTPQTIPYLEGIGFQAVELPYQGNQVSMLVLVPDKGTLDDFENGHNTTRLAEIQAALQPALLRLYLPKFEFTINYRLSELLAGMGMPDAFCTGNPDFSGMVEEGSLCIDQVFHKAFVAVDEKGTEAAAASAVVMMEMSAMIDQPLVVNVDRPFIFLILEKSSGSVLFLGRLTDPRGHP